MWPLSGDSFIIVLGTVDLREKSKKNDKNAKKTCKINCQNNSQTILIKVVYQSKHSQVRDSPK